jgi:hypothetical protein
MMYKSIPVDWRGCPDAPNGERPGRGLRATHPWDVREFVALATADGHDAGLQWVADSPRTR